MVRMLSRGEGVPPCCMYSRNSRSEKAIALATLTAFAGAIASSAEYRRSPLITAAQGQDALAIFLQVVHTTSVSLRLEQRCAQVALADARHDRHDHLALVLRPRRDFGGGGDVPAAGDAGE